MKTEQLSHESTKNSSETFPLVLICDGVTSPANAGSLFRLSDALGINHIYFCNSEVQFDSARFKRTARSTQQHVEFTRVENHLELFKELKRNNYSLVGLELTTTSLPLTEFKTVAFQKIALILGNERYGISQPFLEELDTTVHIPMHGKNSSMNVAQAAAIAVYTLINIRS